jgi:hypothetical protein
VLRGFIEAPEGGLQVSADEGEGEAEVDVDETEQQVSLGQLGDEPDEGNRPGDADERVVTGRGTLEDE